MSTAAAHPVFARVWNAIGPSAMPRRHRRELLEGAAGTRIWPALGAGCHLAPDTGAAIAAARFTVERSRRVITGPGPDRVGLPHLLGLARAA